MELELDRKLSFANKRIEKQERENLKLLEKLKYAISGEQSSAFFITELRRKLQDFTKENEQLRLENEHLRTGLQAQMNQDGLSRSCETETHLRDFARRKISSTKIEDEPVMCSSCSAGISSSKLKEVERIRELEDEVLSLTREKKQLMTHLHWLSRQRAGNAVDFEMQLSLEEGNGNLNDSQSFEMNRTCKDEINIVRRNEMLHLVDQNCGAEDTSTKDSLGPKSVDSMNVLTKLRRLKSTLLDAKKMVTRNKDLCDVIFQLSFQNLRHPYEPQSYSNWSTQDGSSCLSWASLGATMNPFDSLRQPRQGYYSLESFSPGEAMDEPQYNLNCLARKTSASSPDIHLNHNHNDDVYSGHFSPSRVPFYQFNLRSRSKSGMNPENETVNNPTSRMTSFKYSQRQNEIREESFIREWPSTKLASLSETASGHTVSQPVSDDESDQLIETTGAQENNIS